MLAEAGDADGLSGVENDRAPLRAVAGDPPQTATNLARLHANRPPEGPASDG